MRPSLIIFVLNETVRGVRVAYEADGAGYPFKTMDQSIKVDDLVVIETNTRFNFTVGKVVEVDIEPDLDGAIDLKWIAQKVDAEAFNQLLAVETEAINAVNSAEKARKKDELRKSMFAHHEAKMSKLALVNLGSEEVVEQASPPATPKGFLDDDPHKTVG
jgi:hypothetical protein